MNKLIIAVVLFIAVLPTSYCQVDTCFTQAEIRAIYTSKQELNAEIEQLRNIDLIQQQLIKEYEYRIQSDSLKISLYVQSQDELLRLNEYYQNGLKNTTGNKKWYQSRLAAYLGGMTAVLVGAVSISLASK